MCICESVGQRRPTLLKDICSQLSYDTIGSLAIILQPYRTVNDPTTQYIDDQLWQDIRSDWDFSSSYEYYISENNALAQYERFRQMAKDFSANAQDANEQAANDASKFNCVKIISRAQSKLQNVGGVRGAVLSNKNLALAESELRVMSGTLNNDRDRPSSYELKTLYSVQCTLDKPYLLNDKIENVALYHSLPYLIARSDALAFNPKLNYTTTLDALASDQLISIDQSLKGNVEKLRDAYEKRAESMGRILKRFHKKKGVRSEVVEPVDEPADEPVDEPEE